MGPAATKSADLSDPPMATAGRPDRARIGTSWLTRMLRGQGRRKAPFGAAAVRAAETGLANGEAAITAGRHRLLASLSISALIPVLLFGGWVAYVTAERDRTAARQAAFDTASRVAERVTAELRKEVAIAEALAASENLDRPDLGMFYGEARRLADARALWDLVALFEPSGRQVLNILRPWGAPLDSGEDPKGFQALLRTREPTIGEVGQVRTASGQHLVPIHVPVMRDGNLKYVLTIGLVPSGITEILGHAGAPKGWVGAIVDGKGDIVSRTGKDKFTVGAPASAAIREAVERLPEGFYGGWTIDGAAVEAVYRMLPGTSKWSVHFGIPREALNAGVSRSFVLMAGGGLASLGLAAALAVFVARDLAQRRRDEEARAALALRVSEERGALALDAADLGTWRWDITHRKFIASERSRLLLDLSPSHAHEAEAEWNADQFLAAVHERDRARLASAIMHCAETHEPMDVEFRLMRRDGHFRWFRAAGRAVGGAEQTTVHGVLSDIHARKQAEAERVHLLRRLTDAQESEQRRIARELHDQIGQTVTALSLGLKGLEQSLRANGCERDAGTQLRWVQTLAGEVGRDLHRVAADLRPSALDDLGLYKALAAHAAEWSRITGIKADVQALGNDSRLPPEISIAVYRCVQEALTNVVKHAAARNVSVVLEFRPDALRVVVEDDGRGFDSDMPAEGTREAARPRLGLSGIRERLALVGGSLNIESSRDAGTALFLQVPLPEREASA